MEINSELATWLMKAALHPYYEDLYDKTIDTLYFERNDFGGNPVFYHSMRDRYHNQYGEFGTTKYWIFSIKKDEIHINTNIIRTIRYKLETGNEWNHSNYNNIDNYKYNFNKNLEFENSFIKLMAKLRDKRIDEILND
jgi:hypothetical protein